MRGKSLTTMLNTRKYVLVTFFCYLLYLPAFAVPPGNGQFIHLLIEQGVSVASVEAIYKDHLGYMWFGGLEGLIQYDGYNFVTYRNMLHDETSLSSNVIWDIYEDSRGDMWIATDGGLNRFNRDSGNFTRFQHNENSNSLRTNLTRSIVEDSRGNLWIGTFNGLVKLDADRTSFTHFYPNPDDDNSLSDTAIRTIYLDRSGTALWIGFASAGLNRLDLNTGVVKRYAYTSKNGIGTSHGTVVSIFQDKEGFVWLGTEGGGMNRLDTSTEKFSYFVAEMDNPHSISSNFVTGITGDEQGNLWIGTEGGGLNFYDREKHIITRFNHDPNQKRSLSSNIVKRVFIDENHDLWVGNFPGGVSFLDLSTTAFRTYRTNLTNPNSLSDSSVLSIAEDDNGTIWMGTETGGLNSFDRKTNKFIHYKHDPKNPKSISAGAILSILPDDGKLWVGNWHGGLNHFNPQTRTAEVFNSSTRGMELSSNNIWALQKDSDKTLWIGTIGGGAFRYYSDADKFKSYKTMYPFNTDFFLAWKIYQDSQGQIWVGANEGLGRYNRELDRFDFYRHDRDDPESLSFDVVLDIEEDNKQQLWLATRGGGLNIFNKKTGKFQHIREKEGLPSDIVNSLKFDNSGNLWTGSAQGLTRYNPNTGKFINFNEKNGLQGNQFNIGAALKTKSGEMIFGGTAGFTIFNPEKIGFNTTVPPVAIVDFQVFNKSVVVGAPGSPLVKTISQTNQITLNHHHSVFTFSFAAMSYRNTEKNRFAYMLEGFEKEWNYVGADRRNATYTNLNPGTYVFRVKAANSQGVWNEQGKSITLHILPPPWRTWWAFLIYGFIVIGMLYAFVYIQRKNVVKEREINKRLQQLDKLKDEFLANTSHELRTPLNGIIGLAESLIHGAGGPQSESSVTNLTMIVSSGKRLERLVNSILDFSKLRDRSLVLYPKPLDIHAMTDVVLALSKHNMDGKNLRLINDVSNDIPLVYADEDRVQQILHNLIDNAIKFTSSGTVAVSAKNLESHLEIHVSDTGIGMSSEDVKKIFNSFYQVESAIDRKYGGTGLGLTITKQLVELQGGNIYVQSVPGHGSSFYFTLPVSSSNALGSYEDDHLSLSADRFISDVRTPLQFKDERCPVSTNDARAVNLEESVTSSCVSQPKFRILIVDDEAVNRQVLMNHMVLQGYEVVIGRNGSEAIDIATTQTIDLVLLDIMMPGMSGYEVCTKLREVYSSYELPIIFLTGKSQIDDLVTGFAIGANDFLTKPISREELLARVSTHLDLLEFTRDLEKKVNERTDALQDKHLQLEEAYTRLEQISLTDPLTGLHNRRFMQNVIPSDIARILRDYNARHCNELSRLPSIGHVFFLLDIDFFKQVNDTYGHMAGDHLLKEFSELLSRECRESDYLVRWGGEEFLVVSRLMNQEEAPLLAERLRNAICNHLFHLNDGTVLRKTCSIGFARYPFLCQKPTLLSWEQVIDVADQALYLAKKAGRNRYVGLAATETTESDHLYKRIRDNTQDLVELKELNVISVANLQ